MKPQNSYQVGRDLALARGRFAKEWVRFGVRGLRGPADQ